MQPLKQSNVAALQPQLIEESALTAPVMMDQSALERPHGDLQEHANSEELPLLPTEKQSGISGKLAAAVMVGILLFTTFLSLKPANDETVYANWTNHVAELTELNRNSNAPKLKHVSRGGQEMLLTEIGLAAADEDPSTTRSVMKFLERGEYDKANAALQDAQSIPHLKDSSDNPLPRLEPTISPGMQEDLMNGDARFFNVYLNDSCDEDGDVVRILLNGIPFAVVPITNAGVTLSVPVGSGTIISLEGVRDGVGGITVACRTSQGDYFTSAMPVGGVQPISIVH